MLGNDVDFGEILRLNDEQRTPGGSITGKIVEQIGQGDLESPADGRG